MNQIGHRNMRGTSLSNRSSVHRSYSRSGENFLLISLRGRLGICGAQNSLRAVLSGVQDENSTNASFGTCLNGLWLNAFRTADTRMRILTCRRHSILLNGKQGPVTSRAKGLESRASGAPGCAAERGRLTRPSRL